MKEKMINEKYTKLYCIDNISLIENYDKALDDKTQTWVCHHRLEIDEKKSQQQLKAEGRYYHRPASELIFLTNSEHWTLHNLNLRDETRILYSIRNSGKNNAMCGHSIKEFMSEEAYNEWKKKQREVQKNKIWVNNGIENKKVKPEQLQQYLDKGYTKGVKRKKNL